MIIALYSLVFIFGSLIGSFLNVVIYRLPLGMSVMRPPSHCPKCKKGVPFYLNLPVLGYLLLKGKCKFCGVKIPWRYPLIELLVGLFAVALFPGPEMFVDGFLLFKFAYYFSIACVFLCHLVIDLEHHLLLDKLNLYLLVVTLPYALFTQGLIPPLLGGAFGFGATYAIAKFFLKFKGVEGLGGGDIKLFGVLGIMLGIQGVVSTIFMSSLIGSVVSIALMMAKKMDRSTQFAFGPYILLVATFQVFFPRLYESVNFLFM